MFEKSFLPEALFEFVVISDLHFFDTGLNKEVEFLSRRKQTKRALRALQMADALKPDFIIHLGDLIQQYPESIGFHNAMFSALKRLKNFKVKFYHVAGNHDVGDKPDPTMPTHYVTSESLNWYHNHICPSWYSFNYLNCHFVVLNSQIMNTDLKEEKIQGKWLEKDLFNNKNKRIFIFMHLPLYLWDEKEQGLGNYDNLDEPARSWLFDLINKNAIEMLIGGHVHFSFLDCISRNRTKYLLLSSPTFTRGDFSNIFKGNAPPEGGRDDDKKLGFYLFRVLKNRTDIHFVRTEECQNFIYHSSNTKFFMIRSSASLKHSTLGLSLERPLISFSDIPSSWPSIISRRIRNDYPLLSILEMGTKFIEIPIKDLTNQIQNKRIHYIRSEGVAIIASVYWNDSQDILKEIRPYINQIDGILIHFIGTPWPSSSCLKSINAINRNFFIPIKLSCIIPGEKFKNKQHPRTRFGYKLSDLIRLNQELFKNNCKIDSVVCKIDKTVNTWDIIKKVERFSFLTNINSISFNVKLSSMNDLSNANFVAEALFSSIVFSSPLYFQPLLDIDRAMDVTHGLLDNLCNPRPAFQVLKNLNTILNSIKIDPLFESFATTDNNIKVRLISLKKKQIFLISPNEVHSLTEKLLNFISKNNGNFNEQVFIYHLVSGYVNKLTRDETLRTYFKKKKLDEPILILRTK